MMKYYELTYLISSDLSAEEQKNLQEKVASYIQENGKVALAPLIKRRTADSLITLDFYSEPEKIAVLEKKVKSDPKILRHMILVKEAPKAEIKIPRRTQRLSKESFFKTERETEKKKTEEKGNKKKKVELKDVEKKLEEILGE